MQKLNRENSKLQTQNEYKQYIADEAIKDLDSIKKEKANISTNLKAVEELNNVVEILKKVENKTAWSNSVR